MIKKIDHIGIAVPNLEDALKIYRDQLGLKLHAIEEVANQKVKVAMIEVGGVHIELLEPTSEDSPIAKFLAKKGPGMHHICLETDDVDTELQQLAAKEVKLIDQESRPGASGKRVGFLHPKSTGSVLLELNSMGSQE